jgi:transposase
MQWDDEPLVLTLADVCRLMGWTERALRKRIWKHQFATPVATHPYRWSRDAVRHWLEQGGGVTRVIVRREKAPRPKMARMRVV